jgi:hypothetical protein
LVTFIATTASINAAGPDTGAAFNDGAGFSDAPGLNLTDSTARGYSDGGLRRLHGERGIGSAA